MWASHLLILTSRVKPVSCPRDLRIEDSADEQRITTHGGVHVKRDRHPADGIVKRQKEDESDRWLARSFLGGGRDGGTLVGDGVGSGSGWSRGSGAIWVDGGVPGRVCGDGV